MYFSMKSYLKNNRNYNHSAKHTHQCNFSYHAWAIRLAFIQIYMWKKSPFPKTRKDYVASLALWCIIINPNRQACYNIAYMIARELSQQLAPP
jgi:hypothetical protein